MHHLTAIDAGFLQMETAQTPMHLASVHMLELPPDYQGDFPEAFRNHIQSRLHLAPLLTRKLVTMPLDLANPVWVHDDAIDIDYHVRRLSLPSPGNHAQLMAVVGRLHSIIMDRSRPLWEIALIEGVQGGGYAMYLKLHHAGLDGLAGQRLVEALYDVTATPRTVAPPQAKAHERPASTRSLFVASLGNAATQTLRLMRNLPGTSRMVAGMLQGLRTATGEERSPPKQRRFSIGPPRVAFNTTITNQRLFACCSMPIADMKRVTQATGCTLNDVVMAVAAGALRRYLLRCGELPESALLALMPISVRAPGDMEMSNRVSAARCDLHTDIGDPLQRLQAICNSTAGIKRNLDNTRKGMPTDFPSIGVPWVLPAMVALIGKLHLADHLPLMANVVVSNVSLSPQPLFVAGARLASYWPMLILMHGMGLGLATHSYAGSMEWGVVGCRQSMPDVADFADDLLASFAELTSALATDADSSALLSKPTRKRAARRRPAITLLPDETVVKAEPKVKAKAKSITKTPIAKTPINKAASRGDASRTRVAAAARKRAPAKARTARTPAQVD